MAIERRQRRASDGSGKKVNYYVDTETGEQFDTKPERKKYTVTKRVRKERSDKKPVADTNLLPVVYQLLMREGEHLIQRCEGEGDLYGLKLLNMLGEDIPEFLFLIKSCQVRYETFKAKHKALNKKMWAFMHKFFPEEVHNVKYKPIGRINFVSVIERTKLIHDDIEFLDDDNSDWLIDWRAAHHDGARLAKMVKRPGDALKKLLNFEYTPTPEHLLKKIPLAELRRQGEVAERQRAIARSNERRKLILSSAVLETLPGVTAEEVAAAQAPDAELSTIVLGELWHRVRVVLGDDALKQARHSRYSTTQLWEMLGRPGVIQVRSRPHLGAVALGDFLLAA